MAIDPQTFSDLTRVDELRTASFPLLLDVMRHRHPLEVEYSRHEPLTLFYMANHLGKGAWRATGLSR